VYDLRILPQPVEDETRTPHPRRWPLRPPRFQHRESAVGASDPILPPTVVVDAESCRSSRSPSSSTMGFYRHVIKIAELDPWRRRFRA
jgi:hypothetical protein